MTAADSVTHVLTVDLEPWFTRGSALFGDAEGCADVDWHFDSLPGNVEQLVELLDRHGVRATFFVLGPVAEKMPGLVADLARAGHEIALHGYAHKLLYNCTPEELREDLQRSTDVVGEASGQRPMGYRAPYFSVTRHSLWALDVLAELGFRYDSSIFPVARRLYGMPDFCPQATWVRTPAGRELFEVPPATLATWRWKIPVAGGGYWRVLPTGAILRAVQTLERRGQPAVLYLHPYELNPHDAELAADRSSFRNRCMLAWQRMGRRSFAAKLEAVLRRFSLRPLREVFASQLDRPGSPRTFD
ncbi:MAG: polysaccharide deacetylase family protein [Armatimonadetes bacterium]|nr:polysaccharide deacetylase family protein [Armatimonadota bacterium]